MPHKRLIIQYGLNDPQKQEIERLIKRYPHIELVHLETQEDLRDMIARSFAVIYIPENEDFGMIPLEAMSCGVPVIGVNDGGLKETIIHERTGWLL
jgi:glycosyltransferase involved in cell wall biosynthesis